MKRLALLLCACSALQPYTRARQAKLTVRAVESSAPRDTTIVADDGDLLLFDHAAFKAGRAIAEGFHLVRAAAVPAADGSGTWLLGADQEGRLFRLRANGLEDVTSRYGVGAVRDLCAAGSAVVFRLDDGIAVADGKSVARYPLSLDPLACGPGRAVGHSLGRVTAFDVVHRTTRSFSVDAVAAAVDGRGRVIVATPRALYVEDDAGLKLRYSGEALRSLAGGGGRVWFADGAILGALDGDELAVSPPLLPAGTQLRGSPSGDVWALGATPQRFSRDASPWVLLVQPVFTRACADCHLPGGRAGIDLSTAQSWSARKKELEERIFLKRSMPPQGHPLADRDRQAIRSWLDGK